MASMNVRGNQVFIYSSMRRDLDEYDYVPELKTWFKLKSTRALVISRRTQ